MTRAQLWALIALFIAGGLTAGAQFLEHVTGLDPCPLCLMQRIWVMFAGLIVCGALAENPHRGIYPVAVMACAFIGAGFSVRQVYLQSLPADAVPACGPDLAYMLDVLPLTDTLRAMTLGTGSCAEVDWQLLGVSLAGWALVGFGAIAVAAALWWRSIQRAL